jgi:hypothetical protein
VARQGVAGEGMKRSPWFPVWAGFQDDEQFLAVSAEAELLYLRAIARCKQLNQGSDGGHVGRYQLRRLCDKMTADPTDLATQLVAAGLWVETPGGWRIAAYGGWNRSAEEEKAARVEASRLANHSRWRHDGPVDGCPKCNRGVPPGHSGRSPNGLPPGSDPESERGPIPSLDVDGDIDVDKTTPPTPPPPGSGSDAANAELVLVELADALIEALGIVDAVATTGERKLVTRALARGWTPTDLLDEAHDIGGRDDIDSPRRYLGAVLRRMANTGSEHPAAGQDLGVRGLLDDERPPCARCGASGVVGGLGPDGLPDGSPVTPCPDCHVLGASR